MILFFDWRFDCTFVNNCNKEDATDIKLTQSPSFILSCLCSAIGSQFSIDNKNNCKQTPACDYEEDMEVDDKEEDQSDEEMDTA